MVKGLETFARFFKGHEDCYVLIGGTACDLWIESAGGDFRATKDLDVVIVAENVTVAFVKRFWEFHKEGGYNLAQKKSGAPAFFRFKKPKTNNFPSMVELFSRQDLELLVSADKMFTAITADKQVSSLSAILMDADYYDLVITSRVLDENTGIPVSPAPTLIALKIRAFIDLSTRRERGEEIHQSDINKHRNDVFRLIVTLREEDKLASTDSIRSDLKTFVETIKRLTPAEFKSIADATGIKSLDKEIQLKRLEALFSSDKTS